MSSLLWATDGKSVLVTEEKLWSRMGIASYYHVLPARCFVLWRSSVELTNQKCPLLIDNDTKFLTKTNYTRKFSIRFLCRLHFGSRVTHGGWLSLRSAWRYLPAIQSMFSPVTQWLDSLLKLLFLRAVFGNTCSCRVREAACRYPRCRSSHTAPGPSALRSLRSAAVEVYRQQLLLCSGWIRLGWGERAGGFQRLAGGSFAWEAYQVPAELLQQR